MMTIYLRNGAVINTDDVNGKMETSGTGAPLAFIWFNGTGPRHLAFIAADEIVAVVNSTEGEVKQEVKP